MKKVTKTLSIIITILGVTFSISNFHSVEFKAYTK